MGRRNNRDQEQDQDQDIPEDDPLECFCARFEDLDEFEYRGVLIKSKARRCLDCGVLTFPMQTVDKVLRVIMDQEKQTEEGTEHA